jgi:hypothetical protein
MTLNPAIASNSRSDPLVAWVVFFVSLLVIWPFYLHRDFAGLDRTNVVTIALRRLICPCYSTQDLTNHNIFVPISYRKKNGNLLHACK